ncbi:hypothetical protein CSUB01_11368 [Colletotrichum sublineola]|uniref:Uncharacterized protein n=1 Tax=Colletotrichum sublineola TaxID=1173701 RepID=A0A066X938_COLSU|nr:hypothetical protein CSUB01_11368 [Colletotrichum sublineola]
MTTRTPHPPQSRMTTRTPHPPRS